MLLTQLSTAAISVVGLFVIGLLLMLWFLYKKLNLQGRNTIIGKQLQKEHLNNLIIIVDLPGRVDHTFMRNYIDYVLEDIIKRIVQIKDPVTITIMSVNSEIQTTYSITATSLFKHKVATKAQGKTAIHDAFRHIFTESQKPTMVICITDGKFDSQIYKEIDVQISYPVIWAVLPIIGRKTRPVFPFGKAVYY